MEKERTREGEKSAKVIKDCIVNSNTQHFPRTRNFVTDIMKEGRRKNIIYLTFSVDITDTLELIKYMKVEEKKSISFTGYISYCMAKAVDENKVMHAIRKRRKLVLYDNVDIAIMIERKVEGIPQPVNYIIRNANKKDLDRITFEIRKAQSEPLGGDWAMNKIEKKFWNAPKFLRNIFWWFSRRIPDLRKEFVGTVGITSIGMLGTGTIHVFPITPMTLTLAIGTIDEKLTKTKKSIQSRKFLNLTVAADHDIIDGAPITRFIERLKEIIISGYGLQKIQIINPLTPIVN